MSSLAEIETKTKAFAAARDVLRERVQALKDEIEAAKRRRLRGIRAAVQATAAAHEDLWQLVDGSRELFVKPKSMVIAGIKVGLQKAQDGLDWDDDAAVVALIEKHLGEDQVKVLVKTTKKPIEAALKELDDADLEKVGVRSTKGGDVVLIKPVDGEVGKMIDAMLKDALVTEAEDEEGDDAEAGAA